MPLLTRFYRRPRSSGSRLQARALRLDVQIQVFKLSTAVVIAHKKKPAGTGGLFVAQSNLFDGSNIALDTTDGANLGTVYIAIFISHNTFCSTGASAIRNRIWNQKFHLTGNGVTNADTGGSKLPGMATELRPGSR